VFGGFFGHLMSEENYPLVWGNVCEASNFVLLFPVAIAAILCRAWRRRSVTALEWGLSAYLVLTFSWLAIGWPQTRHDRLDFRRAAMSWSGLEHHADVCSSRTGASTFQAGSLAASRSRSPRRRARALRRGVRP
jgi:hypothetical protein